MGAVGDAVAGDEVLVRGVPLGALPAARFVELSAKSRRAVVEGRALPGPSLIQICRRSIGPKAAIWCTAGVSGIEAPAIAAIRGLQTPQATTI